MPPRVTKPRILGVVPPTVIAVQTAPGRDSLLRQTLEQIDRDFEGSLNRSVTRVLFADGFSPRRDDWVTDATDETLGNAQTFFRIVAHVAKQKARLLLFEDDVLVSRKALPYMLRVETPVDAAYAAWFSVRRAPVGLPDRFSGFAYRNITYFSGNCGISIEPEKLELICKSQLQTTWERPNASDQVLSRCPSAPKLYVEHVPHLVQHVGDVSTMNGVPGRRSASFVEKWGTLT